MGSPFNSCDIELSGPWVPELVRSGWLDLAAPSPDGRYLALVRWATNAQGGPAFQLAVLDSTSEVVSWSEAIPGCCVRVGWSPNGITWQAYEGSSGVVPVDVSGRAPR